MQTLKRPEELQLLFGSGGLAARLGPLFAQVLKAPAEFGARSLMQVYEELVKTPMAMVDPDSDFVREQSRLLLRYWPLSYPSVFSL